MKKLLGFGDGHQPLLTVLMQGILHTASQVTKRFISLLILVTETIAGVSLMVEPPLGLCRLAIILRLIFLQETAIAYMPSCMTSTPRSITTNSLFTVH